MSVEAAVAIVGAMMAVPISVLTSLIKQWHWDNRIIMLLAMALSLIGGVLTIAVTGHANDLHSVQSWVVAAGEVFSASQLFFIFFKGTAFEEALALFPGNKLTAPKQLIVTETPAPTSALQRLRGRMGQQEPPTAAASVPAIIPPQAPSGSAAVQFTTGAGTTVSGSQQRVGFPNQPID